MNQRSPCDICFLHEPCDSEVVEGLQYHLAIIRRTTGKHVSLYPPRAESKKKFEDRSEALENSHAVLVILSDNSTVRFKDADGDTDPFFLLVKRAMDLEKEQKVRILPIFLSERVQKGALVGYAKFSNWSYKCKNENVRAVMDRIGSLQGVFMDPDEESYEMKFQKLRGFWQETHSALVPLTVWNMRTELDWETISFIGLGTLLGLFAALIPLCFTCSRSERKRWLYFRKGMLLGNALLFLCASLICLIFGVLVNKDSVQTTSCDTYTDSGVELSDECTTGFDGKTFKKVGFSLGAVFLFIAIVEFAVAHLWANAVVRTVERHENKLRSDTRASSHAHIQVDQEMSVVVSV